jgi:hypothetical protein
MEHMKKVQRLKGELVEAEARLERMWEQWRGSKNGSPPSLKRPSGSSMTTGRSSTTPIKRPPGSKKRGRPAGSAKPAVTTSGRASGKTGKSTATTSASSKDGKGGKDSVAYRVRKYLAKKGSGTFAEILAAAQPAKTFAVRSALNKGRARGDFSFSGDEYHHVENKNPAAGATGSGVDVKAGFY